MFLKSYLIWLILKIMCINIPIFALDFQKVKILAIVSFTVQPS